jgi:hypothetical protein
MTETIDDFIKTSGLECYVLPAHENPHRMAADQNSAYHYSCKLVNRDEQWFVVYFSKGPGIRLWKQAPEMFEAGGKPIHVPKEKVGTQYDGPMPPWTEDSTDRDKEIFQTCSIPEAPHLPEILTCLANDCATIEQMGSFEAWCRKVKASPDSRFAKKTWDDVCLQRQQLQTLIGPEQYHRLLYEIEREISPPKPVNTD